ncbi:hypothetical protein PSAB6_30281 [Paraburkholderia sabiae]|nr:hypothetical protein PSAB6_30281 [Paraburkholderia sabiae]
MEPIPLQPSLNNFLTQISGFSADLTGFHQFPQCSRPVFSWCRVDLYV